MSVWSWLKLTIFLWLLRKIFKAAGWLLLAAVVIAAWPVTLVTAAGYGAAWLRGWPPARLARFAAWALIPAGTWTALQGARLHAWPPAVLGPARTWAHSWSRLAPVDLGRVFLLLAPVAVPAGSPWPGWRGRGGSTRSAPGWAGSRRRRRSGSMPASGAARSAPPRA